MEIDPLDKPANLIVTSLPRNFATFYEPELFFDGDRFLAYLNSSYDEFDVITYSQSKALRPPLPRIRRLIYGLKDSGRQRCKARKHCLNIHVKLFICYRFNMKADAFIGSQNLTHGTNINLMYKVAPRHVDAMLMFFNQIWDSL